MTKKMKTKLQLEREFIQQLKQNGYVLVAISDNDVLKRKLSYLNKQV